VHYNVSTAVNNSRAEGAYLVERAAPPGVEPAGGRMDLLSSHDHPDPK
jgi:hypothetical protein